MTPTCYRALNRHKRGWGWVLWTHSELSTRLAIVLDIHTGDTYPCNPRALRKCWKRLPAEAQRILCKLPPVYRDPFGAMVGWAGGDNLPPLSVSKMKEC